MLVLVTQGVMSGTQLSELALGDMAALLDALCLEQQLIHFFTELGDGFALLVSRAGGRLSVSQAALVQHDFVLLRGHLTRLGGGAATEIDEITRVESRLLFFGHAMTADFADASGMAAGLSGRLERDGCVGGVGVCGGGEDGLGGGG